MRLDTPLQVLLFLCFSNIFLCTAAGEQYLSSNESEPKRLVAAPSAAANTKDSYYAKVSPKTDVDFINTTTNATDNVQERTINFVQFNEVINKLIAPYTASLSSKGKKEQLMMLSQDQVIKNILPALSARPIHDEKIKQILISSQNRLKSLWTYNRISPRDALAFVVDLTTLKTWSSYIVMLRKHGLKYEHYDIANDIRSTPDGHFIKEYFHSNEWRKVTKEEPNRTKTFEDPDKWLMDS